MTNEFFVVGDEVFIKLRSYIDGKFWALIDLIDFDLVNSYDGLWGAKLSHRNYYVCMTRNNKDIYLHRILFDEIPVELEPDHKNNDSLDNRRNNLRLVTHQ